MNLRALASQSFLDRMDLRLAVFGLAAVASVYLGFLGLSVGQAEAFIRHGGYYVLLLTFVLFIWALWRLWLERPIRPSTWLLREHIAVWLVILMFTGVAVAHETFRSKILNDEFVLQSTAFNMHFFREVAAMARGYDVMGTFISTDTFLDKRPNFIEEGRRAAKYLVEKTGEPVPDRSSGE